MIKAKQIRVNNGKVLLGNSSNIASETAYTIPSTNGTAGQVLQHDGSSSLVFSNQKTLSDADNNTKIQVEESSDENKIRFDTAGSERMIITETGKVGIGTETPSRLLDVNGSLLIRNGNISRTTSTTNEAITIDTSNNTTVGNHLTVDGDASSNGIKLSDGLIEMRTGTGNVAQIDMYCEVSNAHKISLKAPAHSEFSGNLNFVLPPSHGTNGQYLKTDGSGNTSWGTVSGGGGGSLPDVATVSSFPATITSYTGIEETLLISNGSNAVSVTLPTASTVTKGYKYNIKKLGTGDATIQSQSVSSGTNQIDGNNSFTISTQNQSITLVSTGSTFYII